jgi:hypothetical protein
MGERTRLVDVTAELRHETADAYLLFDGARTVWVPEQRRRHLHDAGMARAGERTGLARSRGIERFRIYHRGDNGRRHPLGLVKVFDHGRHAWRATTTACRPCRARLPIGQALGRGQPET